ERDRQGEAGDHGMLLRARGRGGLRTELSAVQFTVCVRSHKGPGNASRPSGGRGWPNATKNQRQQPANHAPRKSKRSLTLTPPAPLKAALGLWANQAERKSKRSCTLTAPEQLKSAGQTV